MDNQRLTRPYVMLGSGIMLATLLFLHAGPARAGEAGDETTAAGTLETTPESAARTPVGTQGMRVYRDPQTGQLGPLPPGAPPLELSPAERRMLNRSGQGLQERSLPRGGVAVDLQGRFQNMAVVTVGADGRAAVNCELTPAQARAALQAGQQAGTGSAD